MEEQKDKTFRYFGITIGPITRVISYAKATRGIWAASYFFSWLSEEIVRNLYAAGHTKVDFLKPLGLGDSIPAGDTVGRDPDTVGRYPDQYIFKAKDKETLDDIKKAIADAITTRSKALAEIEIIKKQQGIIETYINRNIRVAAIELECKEDEAFDLIHSYLGVLDNQDIFQAQVSDGEDYLKILLDKSTKINNYRKLFFPNSSKLESLPGFINMEAIDKEKHYVAFVSADGDNFGKNIKFLAHCLNEINPDTNKSYYDIVKETIESFGGQVVFQGGDDLVFYAPLRGKYTCTGTEIFALIDKLDSIFKEYVIERAKKDYKEKNKKEITWNEAEPTLSYGVAMGYYEHPMNETREDAESLLWEIKGGKEKDAIRWKLRKHSGQSSGGVILKKNVELFEKIRTLAATALANQNEHEFLHSLTHGVIRHRNVVEHILDTDKSLLDNFFYNNFKKIVHKELEGFISAIKDILKDDSFAKGEDAVEFVHGILRYVELLIRKEKMK